jgi:hypothetical protein
VNDSYSKAVLSSKFVGPLQNTLYMAIIPTLMYTLHNYDVLSRASDPESSQCWQTARLILAITFGVGLIFSSVYVGIYYFQSISDLTWCIIFVAINYFTASWLLAGTIFKAKGLA